MEEKLNQNIVKKVYKPKKLMLINPKGESIMVLNSQRDVIVKTVPSMTKIIKVLTKSEPFSFVEFEDNSSGWVISKYILEV